MNYTELMDKLSKVKNGRFCTVTWEKPADVRKAFKGLGITKKTTMHSLRVGINYDNMASVQVKRMTGELPVLNAGLSWGEKSEDKRIIEYKGKQYLQLYTSENSTAVSEYFIDGKPVKLEDVESMLLASNKREKSDTFMVTIDNIVDIK